MGTSNYTIRIDDDLRAEASALFEGMGFTLPSAVNAFLRRSVADQAFPFELKAVRLHGTRRMTLEGPWLSKRDVEGIAMVAEANRAATDAFHCVCFPEDRGDDVVVRNMSEIGAAMEREADSPAKKTLDMVERLLVDKIEALGEAALADFEAVMYLGRGDYDDFPDARDGMRAAPWSGLHAEAVHCASKMPLAEYLRRGMELMTEEDWAKLRE